MNEKKQNVGRALVLQDAQGALSWVEISTNADSSSIIKAREGQGYTVFDITTVERAKKLVNPPTPSIDDFLQFRR